MNNNKNLSNLLNNTTFHSKWNKKGNIKLGSIWSYSTLMGDDEIMIDKNILHLYLIFLLTYINTYASISTTGQRIERRTAMRKKEYTLQDAIEQILKLIDLSDQNYRRQDVFRTNHCTAFANSRATALMWIGLDYDFGTWMDDEYERVGFFMVDDVLLVKNGEILLKNYADAVLDDTHAWGETVITGTKIRQ